MVATSFNGNSNSVVGWSKVIKKVERARGIDEAAVNPDWRLSYAQVSRRRLRSSAGFRIRLREATSWTPRLGRMRDFHRNLRDNEE